MNPIEALVNQLRADGIKIGVFVLGLALFVMAWWILLHGDK